MEHFKKTEFIILLILWFGSLTTYSVALLNGYNLFTSDFLGLAGLSIATAVSIFKPEKSLNSVLILLLFGLFNVLSFVYYFNIIFSFGFSILVTPGIQLISLLLLSVLVVKNKDKVATIYRSIFFRTAEEKEQAKQSAQNQFKRKFVNLTDKEIAFKIDQGLIPEATEALKEIQEDRKNALQQHL